jgi:uncharacterized protein (DUF1800 family)
MLNTGNLADEQTRAMRRPSAIQAFPARVALQRFGLGPKPNGYLRIGADPRRALLAELNKPGIALLPSAGLPTYAAAARAAEQDFTAADDIFKRESRVRFLRALQPEIGFVERLVLFWSNHFSMSVAKNNTIRAMVGQWEREVVRKNVLGNFADMLVDTIRHPTMVSYLDNQDSIGPNAVVSQWWNVGINQNLAREILELHTLGVRGGYTQDDVISLAKIITGWSYVRAWESDNGWNGATQANRGQFIYRADWHEPGPQTVLGRTYAASGIKTGLDVLRDLAVHPMTAQHIAYKLVLHFITDTPTPAMVDPVRRAFQSTKGDLKATATALINLPAALKGPLGKIRTPYELQIGQFRATGFSAYDANDEWAVYEPLRALDHRPFERQTPDGYPDETSWWMNPDAITVRADTAQLFYDVFCSTLNLPAPEALGAMLFGPALSAASRARLATMAGRSGYATLFMTPEFQRR